MHALIEQPYQQLATRFRQGKLVHAIIVSAPSGVGKQKLVELLGQFILCSHPNHQSQQPCFQCKTCLLVQARTHPDFFRVTSDKSHIGIDAIRLVTGFIQKTAQLGNAKVVILPEVDDLTESAANALLKTLEEPTDNSFLLMTTADVGKLLPTIVSRCQVMQLKLPTGLALASMAVNKSDVSLFSNVLQLPELTNSEQRQLFIQSINLMSNWLTNHADGPQVVDLLASNDQALRWFEWLVVNLLRHKQTASVNIPLDENVVEVLNKRYNQQQLTNIYSVILQTLKLIKQNAAVNIAMAIEKMLFDITQLNNKVS